MMDESLIPNLFKVRTHQIVSLEQNCYSMQNTNKNPVPVKFLGAVRDMHTNWQRDAEFRTGTTSSSTSASPRKLCASKPREASRRLLKTSPSE